MKNFFNVVYYIDSMPASPIVFTYTYPGDEKLENYFENQPTSPLQGLSFTGLYTLQSPNIVIQGVTLTLQTWSNNAPPQTGATTFLQVGNVSIIASIGTNTIGTLAWTQQIQNLVPGTDTTTRVTKVSSVVSAASGIFANYLFGNIIRQFDNSTNERIITIYSSE
jgi:hypothetical protein